VVGRQLARTMPRVRSISPAVLLVAESHRAVIVRVDSAWGALAPSIRSIAMRPRRGPDPNLSRMPEHRRFA
jgi:hypothetical protein